MPDEHTKSEPKSKQVVGTNDQKQPYSTASKAKIQIKLLAGLFQILEFLSPALAGWWATRIWYGTRRFSEPKREKKWRECAVVSELTHKYGPIKLYQWFKTEQNAPRVLLIHGWNGRGPQLGAFVKPLLAKGFQVVTFDGPGHGQSAGKESNLMRFAEVVHSISDSIGPIDSIVSHSFGAMVMARVAVEGLKIRKAVAISAPKNTEFLIDGFCSVFKITGKSKAKFLLRVKCRFGDDIFTRISTLNNVKQLSLPGLIVHDNNDHDIPVSHAFELNKHWSESKLLISTNLGHHRILREESIINKVVNFIATDC